MDSKKENTKDSIVDFIDDDEYYQVRKYKEQIEKGTLAIYIFAALVMLGFLFSFLRNLETIDWLNAAINFIIAIIYFCLGAFSNQKPFTAFIGVLCSIGFVFLANLFLSSDFNFRGSVLSFFMIVYMSMRLEAAKKVQAYESKNKK